MKHAVHVRSEFFLHVIELGEVVGDLILLLKPLELKEKETEDKQGGKEWRVQGQEQSEYFNGHGHL